MLHDDTKYFESIDDLIADRPSERPESDPACSRSAPLDLPLPVADLKKVVSGTIARLTAKIKAGDVEPEKLVLLERAREQRKQFLRWLKAQSQSYVNMRLYPYETPAPAPVESDDEL